jgi:hypothetical protein
MERKRLNRAVFAILFSATALFLVWGSMNCSEISPSADAGPDGGGKCTSSAQCKINEVCRNGSCVPAGTCVSGGECDGGQCVNGKCTWTMPDGGDQDEPDGNVPDGGQVCEKDEDCGTGYRCNLNNHTCEAAGIISVDPPDTLNFGAVPYGQEITLPVTITNKGKASLQITGFELQNPAGNVCFRIVSGGTPGTLAPDAYQTVQVAYKQNSAATDEGKLRIASSDTKTPIYALTLKSAYKGLPKFAVVDATTEAVLYPLPGAGYDYGIDFGYVSQGTIKHIVTAIKNITDGDAILSLNDFTALNTPKNSFTVVFREGADPASKALPTPVQANNETHIYLAKSAIVYMHTDYDAQVKAVTDGQNYKLTTNDDDINASGNKGNYAVTFKMTAKSAKTKIEVSPLTVDFGEVQKGQSSTRTVTISNKGDADLSILSTSGLKNTSGTFYSLNPATLEKVIPSQGEFAVEVTFSPTAVSSETNYLEIESDDGELPHIEVTLNGTGTDPTLLVVTNPAYSGTPPTIDFGNVIRGNTTTGTVSVKNSGYGNLMISSITLIQGVTPYYTIVDMKLNGTATTLPVTLAEQLADELTYTIQLIPDIVGNISAQMKFDNSDAKSKDFAINLAAVSKNNSGGDCQTPDECSTGFCVDNICCLDACDKACESCNQDQYKGTCKPVTSGPDPRGKCQASPKPSCGQTGNCLGVDNCELWNGDTECVAPACTSGNAKLKKSQHCNGSGTCNDPDEVNCSPYMCDTSLAVADCKKACSSDLDCAPGYACDPAGVCKLAKGQSCQTGTQCASGFCSESVCCSEACDKSCERCDQAPVIGNCSAVGAGLSDPKSLCETKDKSTCNTDGLCSGTRGVCELWAKDTGCKDATCSTDKTTSYNPKKCDGAGLCEAKGEVPCAPYMCNPDTGICRSVCTVLTDCASNANCLIPLGQSTGTCKLVDGQTCKADTECYNGFCSDGVCCNERCGASCEKCNLASYVGICSPVGAGQADPKLQCITQSQQSCGYNGLCSGTRGACQKWGGNTTCVPPTCNGDILSLANTCGGDGVCYPNGTQSCVPYTCSNGVCLTSCNSSGDCAENYSCNTSTHVCKKDDGQKCAVDDECSHGFCTDGYCCNARCNGVCESCRLTDRHGFCDPIPAGGDPDNECEQQGIDTCGRTGYCSGIRSCQQYPLDTVCVPASCSANVANLARKCNGTGICNPGSTQTCFPYICDAITGACKTTCSLNTDCQTGYTCDGSNTCKKNDSLACGSDQECLHGFCTDGVCCASRCNGICESCNLSGRAGYCDPIAAGTDPQGECAWSDPANCGQNGYCSGTRSCQLWALDTVCIAASCTGDVLNKTHKCNGAGTCQDPGDQDCTPYACNASANACKTTCANDNDCATGYGCNGSGVCKKKDGQSCGINGDCLNNSCCSGTCRNLSNDNNNCGTCGTVCQQNHATNTCTSGACVPACNTGYANCNSNVNDGCEKDISSYVHTSGTAVYEGSACGEEQCYLFCAGGAGRRDFFAVSGTQSDWFYARAEQCSSSCDSYVSHRVILTVPAGVTYRLCVYKADATTAYGCQNVSGGSATILARESDATFYYFIEVKYIGGQSCESWSLDVDWNKC